MPTSRPKPLPPQGIRVPPRGASSQLLTSPGTPHPTSAQGFRILTPDPSRTPKPTRSNLPLVHARSETPSPLPAHDKPPPPSAATAKALQARRRQASLLTSPMTTKPMHSRRVEASIRHLDRGRLDCPLRPSCHSRRHALQRPCAPTSFLRQVPTGPITTVKPTESQKSDALAPVSAAG